MSNETKTEIGCFWIPGKEEEKIKGKLTLGSKPELELSGSLISQATEKCNLVGKLSGHTHGAVTLFNCLPTLTKNDYGPGTGWQNVHTDTAIIGPGWPDDQSPEDIYAKELTTSIWPMAQIVRPHAVRECRRERSLAIRIEPYTIEIPDCEKEERLFTVLLNRRAGKGSDAQEGTTTLREACSVTIIPESGRERLGFLRQAANELQMLITLLVNQSTIIEGMTFLHIETPENIVDGIFEIHAHWRGEKTQQDNMLRPVCLLEENNKDIIRNWFGETEKYGPSAHQQHYCANPIYLGIDQ